MEPGLKQKNNILYISWQPYCSRSDNTARELGGTSFLVYYEFFGSNYFTILFKYIFQSIKTLFILFREKPDVVFVMSPPLFAGVGVYFYCKLFHKQFVIDAHTGAFIDDMWQKVLFLQRFLCRKAAFTIVTNKPLADIVTRWQGKPVIVPDIPIQFPAPVFPELAGKKKITLVNSFAVDEPLAQFLQAAEKFPDIHFYITGKLNAKAAPFQDNPRDNIHFTDFIPDEQYHGLLLSSDLIAVLTSRDHTMQRGAYEAIYLGRPVLTSDWPLLRENFPKGAVFVDNTVDGIAAGIQTGIDNLFRLQKEAQDLKAWKLANWEQRKTGILSILTDI